MTQEAPTGESTIAGIELRGSYARRIRSPIIFGRHHLIGSGPECDILVEAEEIADHHAVLQLTGDGLHLLQHGHAPLSINGEAVTAPKRLHDGDLIAFGQMQFQIVFLYAVSEASHQATPPSEQRPPPEVETIIFGRSSVADHCIDSPLAARKHAIIRTYPDGRSQLSDLRTVQGTYLNLRRIKNDTTLAPSDEITIAGVTYVWDGSAVHPTDVTRGITLEAQGVLLNVTNAPSRQKDTDDVPIDFVVVPGEFVVFVCNGYEFAQALLNNLSGDVMPQSGTIIFNGHPVAEAYEAYTSSIITVSTGAESIRCLGMQEEMLFSAGIKLPSDTTESELQMRCQDATVQLPMADKKTLIDPACRIQLATALLTQPCLLLAEPLPQGETDKATERELLQALGTLTTDRRSILAVAQHIENVRSCDLVGYLYAGQLIYFGPPQQIAAYFGVSESDIAATLTTATAAHWATVFRRSDYYDTYIRRRTRPRKNPERGQSNSEQLIRLSGSRWSWSRLSLLCREHLIRVTRDRKYLVHALLQTPILSVLGLLALQSPGLELRSQNTADPALLLAVMVALVAGLGNTALELPRDRRRFLNYWKFGVRADEWVLSKFSAAAILGALQAVELVAVMALASKVPTAAGFEWLILYVVILQSASLGLLIGAICRKRSAVLLLGVTVAMAQAWSGGLLSQQLTPFSELAPPTTVFYWAGVAQKAVTQSPATWYTFVPALAVLVGSGSVLAGLAVWATARRPNPHRKSSYLRN